MASITFHLISVNDEHAFLEVVRSADRKPHYVGHCEHWIHSPKTSLDAFTGSGPEMQRWDYLVIANAEADDHLALPPYIQNNTTILKHWSITAPADLSTLPDDNTRRASSTPVHLPPGWSPSDYSSLTASIPPSDLEASLALAAIPLGSSKHSRPIDLKSFISDFGQTHTGPVGMFNIIACNPGQRTRFYGYVAAFAETIGSRYGGEAQFLGAGVTDWSSRVAEGAQVADPKANGSAIWEDVALVWYPSIWHFGKLLDDPDYAEADRRLKVGAIHDNPIMCCTEVVV